MQFSIDMDEMEQKRYDHIKKSGKYIELGILIGVEKDTFDGHIGKLPVVATNAYDCGPEEIANMYITLKTMVAYYEREYPIECALANATMTSTDMGIIGNKLNNEEN